jgi:hypothetical protein
MQTKSGETVSRQGEIYCCPRNGHACAAFSCLKDDAMSDDVLKRGQPDRSHINMHEDYEVKYWSKHLGVTREELQRLVDKVGNGASAVRKELGHG